MLFNSFEFALFFPVVFIAYWFFGKSDKKKQNIILFIASYIFYGWWDVRFLFLLAFSTALDYFTGIKIAESEHTTLRKTWLWISIGTNLAFLGIFKYYNFFVDSFASLLGLAGIHVDPVLINVILPVGISFYTFHGLSYVIDIYYRRICPERNIIDYSLFVSFFPLLVAGPIERATHLLPQLKKARIFDYSKAIDGLRQILWGLFKKIVIADSCAEYVNQIFSPAAEFSGSTNLLGALLFTVQIYCDFSGYSDIALGTARLLGIELLKNFSFPYFSRDIGEFWRRWHISLSTWFRDYLYIPLGGSKGGMAKKIRNTFIIFLVSGFWHGANWTFIVWGLLNAIYFIPLLLLGVNRSNLDTVATGRVLPNIKELASMLVTFGLTVFAWIFFRAESLSHASGFIGNIFSSSIISMPQILPQKVLFLILLFFLMEWMGREYSYGIQFISKVQSAILRRSMYVIIALAILIFGRFAENQFIYFQF